MGVLLGAPKRHLQQVWGDGWGGGIAQGPQRGALAGRLGAVQLPDKGLSLGRQTNGPPGSVRAALGSRPQPATWVQQGRAEDMAHAPATL